MTLATKQRKSQAMPAGHAPEKNNRRIYLDHNAAQPLHPVAKAAFLRGLDAYGNASAITHEGRRQKTCLEHARHTIARSISSPAEGIVFTSCASEALQLALYTALRSAGVDAFLVLATEHKAMHENARFLPRLLHSGTPVHEVPVDARGVADRRALEKRLARLRETGIKRPLLCFAHAHNETGVLQPALAMIECLHACGGLVLLDACQSWGKHALPALGADFLVLSGHKAGAGPGAALLCARPDIPLQSLLHGGGQENGARAGTENIPAILALAAMADYFASTRLEERQRIAASVRAEIETCLARERKAHIWGAGAERLAHVSCMSLPGYTGQQVVMRMDMAGVSLATGAACSSSLVVASDALLKMGASAQQAAGAFRLSTGLATCSSDAQAFLRIVAQELPLRKADGPIKDKVVS